MKSNAGPYAIHSDYCSEFRAYDRLPRTIREALQNANIKWSAQDVLEFRRAHTIQETLELIIWADTEFARKHPILDGDA